MATVQAADARALVRLRGRIGCVRLSAGWLAELVGSGIAFDKKEAQGKDDVHAGNEDERHPRGAVIEIMQPPRHHRQGRQKQNQQHGQRYKGKAVCAGECRHLQRPAQHVAAHSAKKIEQEEPGIFRAGCAPVENGILAQAAF